MPANGVWGTRARGAQQDAEPACIAQNDCVIPIALRAFPGCHARSIKIYSMTYNFLCALWTSKRPETRRFSQCIPMEKVLIHACRSWLSNESKEVHCEKWEIARRERASVDSVLGCVLLSGIALLAKLHCQPSRGNWNSWNFLLHPGWVS